MARPARKSAEAAEAGEPPFDDVAFDDLLRRLAVTVGGLPEFCAMRDCRRVRRCIGPAQESLGDPLAERPPCWETALRLQPKLADLVCARLLLARVRPSRSARSQRRT